MQDLFGAPAEPAQPPKSALQLHEDTDIYRAIAELNKYVARTTANFRRDIKPTYGVLLCDEASRMAVVFREANIARDAAKVPYYEEILRQLEYIQFTLRTLHDLGQPWLPHSTYLHAVPLIGSIASQAHKLKARFAPSP